MEKNSQKSLQRSLSQFENLQNKTVDPVIGKYIEDVNTGINNIHSASQNVEESIDNDTRKNFENISRSEGQGCKSQGWIRAGNFND